MKKSLVKKDGVQNVIERVAKLNDTCTPLWGSMSVTAMLNHCNGAMRATLEGKASNKRSTIKQRMLKIMMLYILPKFPKNAKAPSRLIIQNGMTAENFEIERRQFIELVNQFMERQTPILVSHPYFGKLNARHWGIFTWMHLDHHLRQFGV